MGSQERVDTARSEVGLEGRTSRRLVDVGFEGTPLQVPALEAEYRDDDADNPEQGLDAGPMALLEIDQGCHGHPEQVER